MPPVDDSALKLGTCSCGPNHELSHAREYVRGGGKLRTRIAKWDISGADADVNEWRLPRSRLGPCRLQNMYITESWDRSRWPFIGRRSRGTGGDSCQNHIGMSARSVAGPGQAKVMHAAMDEPLPATASLNSLQLAISWVVQMP